MRENPGPPRIGWLVARTWLDDWALKMRPFLIGWLQGNFNFYPTREPGFPPIPSGDNNVKIQREKYHLIYTQNKVKKPNLETRECSSRTKKIRETLSSEISRHTHTHKNWPSWKLTENCANCERSWNSMHANPKLHLFPLSTSSCRAKFAKSDDLRVSNCMVQVFLHHIFPYHELPRFYYGIVTY